jgi:ADP-dependent NAD(P)H-hydrate dehydratase / NAD(P)H-hydrate epimerase
VIPILTPEEMRAVDAAAPEPLDVLVRRAGGAVARTAIDMLDGAYGRRVVVIAGPGNNGADGLDAARRLRARGVHVDLCDAKDVLEELPRCDLVIDAAYGTGFHGTWDPPDIGTVPVLAVDIPSGVDGLTGRAEGHVLFADRTVTFAALKPGLLFSDGAAHAGEIEVVDIGLDVSSARAHLVTEDDLVDWLPTRPADAHKYHSAVWLVAGSPGMTGAAALAATGAQRAGAGYVRLSSPGTRAAGAPIEAVLTELPAERWASTVLGGLDRFKAVAVGPGLGRGSDDDVRRVARECTVPLVVDGDGLTALGRQVSGLADDVVLTPHDGEYARLMGHAPGDDRLDAGRDLASASRATVVLKGEAMVVASPSGEVLVAAEGDARLATAGSGDVLTGITVALLAQGLAPPRAAAAAAFLLGAAADLGWRRGLVAGDVAALVPVVLEKLGGD